MCGICRCIMGYYIGIMQKKLETTIEGQGIRLSAWDSVESNGKENGKSKSNGNGVCMLFGESCSVGA